MGSALSRQLTHRFFRYLAITSQSDPRVNTLPSTPGQHDMARELAQELAQLGLDDIVIDEYATVTAVKKGNVAGAPRIGFITHIDTVDVGLSPDIHPQILKFTGEDLCLNKEKSIWLRVKEHPEILAYPGEEIIFSDGTSVLGADNKAAVTVVMTLLENLTPEHQHGDIVVAFVPDEEIGLCGAKALDLNRFDVDFAWTIDCCELGEIVYENFNAASAVFRITGVSVHPGSAKDTMVNALKLACEIDGMLPPREVPEHTEGREGFFHMDALSGDTAAARLEYIVRDHDREKFEARKELLRGVEKAMTEKYPTARVELALKDSYYNMLEQIRPCMHLIDNAKKACEAAGVQWFEEATRGGTDGARLSYMGLPCPNLGTGGHNFHGPYECITAESMDKAVEIILNIIALYAA